MRVAVTGSTGRLGRAMVEALADAPFTGPAGLTRILSSEHDAFAKALASKMLTYALGRGLEPYDRRTVRMIARRLPQHEYRFSGLVMEIVNSLPFRMRQGVVTP